MECVNIQNSCKNNHKKIFPKYSRWFNFFEDPCFSYSWSIVHRKVRNFLDFVAKKLKKATEYIVESRMFKRN